MTAAAPLVRAARTSRGLTQGQLADRSGIDQASVSRSERGREAGFGTIDRLLAAAGHRLYSAPTRRDDASRAAAAIRHHLRAGQKDRALRVLLQLNDDLLAEHGLVRGVLGVAEPGSTGDPVWDAAIAALVAWRLADEGVPSPDWVAASNRFLEHTRTLDVDPADPTPPLREVPEEFLRRNVLVWRDTFVSI
jgi:transcriptional regulator with XRE-family HTH domain